MRRWLLGLVGGALACGPSTTAPMAEGGTSAASESGGDETDESGAESADDEPGETGMVDVCEELLDEASGREPLIIEIHNVGEQAILLPDPCSSRDWLELTTDSEWKWPIDFCSGTCEQTMNEGCFDCGGCAEAAYVVLPPGNRIAVEWDGILYERVAATESCFEFGTCAPSCEVARAAGAETILATVEAITEADCIDTEPSPEEACQCEPGPDGWCETYGSALIDPTVQATIEIDPTSAGPVVIELSG